MNKLFNDKIRIKIMKRIQCFFMAILTSLTTCCAGNIFKGDLTTGGQAAVNSIISRYAEALPDNRIFTFSISPALQQDA